MTLALLNIPPLDLALRALLLVLGLALLHVAWRARRQSRCPAAVSPSRLFRRLAGWLDVSRRDRRLLARLAHHQRLPAPAALLLSPHVLRRHGRAYLAACRPSVRPAVAHRLERLALRLEQQPAQD